jgi:hypothetical protein
MICDHKGLGQEGREKGGETKNREICKREKERRSVKKIRWY